MHPKTLSALRRTLQAVTQLRDIVEQLESACPRLVGCLQGRLMRAASPPLMSPAGTLSRASLAQSQPPERCTDQPADADPDPGSLLHELSAQRIALLLEALGPIRLLVELTL